MMNRRVAAFVAVALSACAQAGDDVFYSGFQTPIWTQGYFVGYENGLYPIAEIDFSAVTHLMVGRVVPNPDGSMTKNFDIDNTNGPLFAQQSVDAAHAAGRKALLMVGGSGEESAWVSAASASHRAVFVTNLLQTMDQFGFDGLDLDWEPLDAATDRAEMLALAGDLRAARPNMLMTFPARWVNSNFEFSDAYYGTLSGYFDRINIMTYDMSWDGDGWSSWFTSALKADTGSTPSSVNTSVAYYLASGVPSQKLGVGMGFYGDCWHGVTAPRQAIPAGAGVVASDGTMSYAKIMASYYNASRYHWDATAQVPWLGSANAFGPQSCTFVSYEDAQSIAQKGAFVKQNGLGGSIIWTISQGHIAGNPVGQRDPLLDAVRSSFLH